MSGGLTFFQFEGCKLRTIDIDGDPWFVVSDLCAILGLGTPSRVVERLGDDEKGMTNYHTLGGEQQMIIVSEAGLYLIVLRCQKALTPGTVPYRFRRWVTGVVLPSLRKTGIYVMPTAEPAQTAPLEDERHLMLSLAVVREARQVFGRAQARNVWRSLGLPDVGDDRRPPRVLSDGPPESVVSWKEECTRPVEGWVRTSELWRSYQNFCAAHEVEPVNQSAFGLALNGLGHVSKKNGVVERYGLTVLA